MKKSISKEATVAMPQESPTQSARSALWAWAIFDWGNSAFATVIQTFVFAAYFVSSVAPTDTVGTAAWGTVTAIAALIVAAISPIFGAISDQGGGRKLWLGLFVALCVITTSCMWYIKPSPDYMWQALLLMSLGIIGAEGANIFYNAMLPELSPPSQLGRWSGIGWGMGYLGGMAALVIALETFIKADSPWIALNPAEDAPIRASFILVAIWIAIFTLPLFFFAPSTPSYNKSYKAIIRDGMSQLWTTLREIRQYKNIVKFLIAKALYIDGLATLFAFGGIYAATVFGMTSQEVLEFGIAMNVTAGLGAAALAFLDDKFGSRTIILYSIIGLIIPATGALIVTEKWQFTTLALTMCLFVGPVQASSRALMSRMAPPDKRRQMFGFYTLSGKATAFLGPLMYGWITYLSGSLRWGMSTIIFLFILGGLVMLTLPRKLEYDENSAS